MAISCRISIQMLVQYSIVMLLVIKDIYQNNGAMYDINLQYEFFV